MSQNTLEEVVKKPAPKLTVDSLLQQKRQARQTVRPSDGFWESNFAPSFARKMMAALGRPRRQGRALTIFGWLTPFVFLSIFAVAVAVAYIFSPSRAIARWEASANQKQYVMDSIAADATVAGKNYTLDHSQNTMTGQENGVPTSGVTSYHFTSATDTTDNHSDF